MVGSTANEWLYHTTVSGTAAAGSAGSVQCVCSAERLLKLLFPRDRGLAWPGPGSLGNSLLSLSVCGRREGVRETQGGLMGEQK